MCPSPISKPEACCKVGSFSYGSPEDQESNGKPKHSQPPRSKNTRKNKASSKKKKTMPKKSIQQDTKQEMTMEEQGRFVALDCEFVGVGPDSYTSALARVSIVDWNNAVLLDTYVKVNEPVTDYRTFVSGIREEHVQSDLAMDTDKCIDLVQKILKNKILVGHGLRCDLGVMGIHHPWYDTRDTARFEPFMKKNKNTDTFQGSMLRPRKLKDLTLTKLGRTIQKEGHSHCSIEDAIAALDLYKKAQCKWEKAIAYKISRTREVEWGQ